MLLSSLPDLKTSDADFADTEIEIREIFQVWNDMHRHRLIAHT